MDRRARSLRASTIDACGAQATPLRTNAAFSSPRSWQIATAAAAGATGRRRARASSAAAGTFSNSVVIAAQRSRETASASAVEVCGAQMLVRDQAGRAGRIGVEHRRPSSPSRCAACDEHAAELAAADDAERGARRDPAVAGRRAVAPGALPLRRRAHFSSALIARAASVWRWRYASSSRAQPGVVSVASIATANRAALAAPALPIANVATGMPLGIWTIE